MPAVSLLTEGRDGEVAVPHPTLTFLRSGLALDMADGEPVWATDWDGCDGIAIVVVQQGHELQHRFLSGTDDAATEAEIRNRTATHELRSSSLARAVSRPLWR